MVRCLAIALLLAGAIAGLLVMVSHTEDGERRLLFIMTLFWALAAVALELSL